MTKRIKESTPLTVIYSRSGKKDRLGFWDIFPIIIFTVYIMVMGCWLLALMVNSMKCG